MRRSRPRWSSTPSPPSSTPTPPSSSLPFLAPWLAHQTLPAPCIKPSHPCFALSSSVWSPLPGRNHLLGFKFEIPCFDSSLAPYCLPPSCSDSSPFPGRKKALCPRAALDKESALFRLSSFYETPSSPSSPLSPTEPYWGFLAGSINCRDSDQSRSGAHPVLRSGVG